MVRFRSAAITAPTAASVRLMTVDPRRKARGRAPEFQSATTESATWPKYTVVVGLGNRAIGAARPGFVAGVSRETSSDSEARDTWKCMGAAYVGDVPRGPQRRRNRG